MIARYTVARIQNARPMNNVMQIGSPKVGRVTDAGSYGRAHGLPCATASWQLRARLQACTLHTQPACAPAISLLLHASRSPPRRSSSGIPSYLRGQRYRPAGQQLIRPSKRVHGLPCALRTEACAPPTRSTRTARLQRRWPPATCRRLYMSTRLSSAGLETLARNARSVRPRAGATERPPLEPDLNLIYAHELNGRFRLAPSPNARQRMYLKSQRPFFGVSLTCAAPRHEE